MGALGISVVMEVLIAIGLIAVLFMLANPKGKPMAAEKEKNTGGEAEISASSEPPTETAENTDVSELPSGGELEEPATEISYYGDKPQQNDIVLSEIAEADAVREEYRLAKSFTAKLVLSSDELKARYSEIKNALLSYKKVKSRTSWKCETFRRGRTVLAKFMIRGKTLCLYLALFPAEISDKKYKVEKVEQKANATTPTLYKIRSFRRVKYAKQLIIVLAEKYGLMSFERQPENYAPEYLSDEELLSRGLIRRVKSVPFNGRQAVLPE